MSRRRYNQNFRVFKNFLKKRFHYKRQAKKIIIVLIILIFIFILKNLNNKTSSKTIQIIDNCINYEFSIKEDGKAILSYGKTLLTLPKETLAVLNIKENTKYRRPIDGNLYSPFGKVKYLDGSTSFNNGVDIIPKEDKEPISIDDGIVKNIENRDTKGYFVTIEHEGITTVYGYLVSVYLTEGEKVLEGTKIGSLGTNKDGNKYLNFEIWVDNEPVNPLDYISLDKKLWNYFNTVYERQIGEIKWITFL